MKRLFSCDTELGQLDRKARISRSLLSRGVQREDAPLRDLVLVNNLLQSARSSRISSAQDHKHFKKKKLLASHAAMLSQEEEAPFVYVETNLVSPLNHGR